MAARTQLGAPLQHCCHCVMLPSVLWPEANAGGCKLNIRLLVLVGYNLCKS
jgi:hypothetical protein